MNVLQGVTLTDLKEAQRTNSLSPQDRQIEEGGTLDERSCPRKGLTDERGVKMTESVETTEIKPKRSIMDEVSKRNSRRNQFRLPAAETDGL